MKHFIGAAALAAVIAYANAQQHVEAYGQCGGQNFNGAKACAPGFHCHAYNDWYSQCVHGESSGAVGTGSGAIPTNSTSGCNTRISKSSISHPDEK
jgi:hypothetical protein